MQGFPGIFCYILGVKVTDLVSLKDSLRKKRWCVGSGVQYRSVIVAEREVARFHDMS